MLVDIGTLDNLRIVLDPIGQVGVSLALMLVMFSVALAPLAMLAIVHTPVPLT